MFTVERPYHTTKVVSLVDIPYGTIFEGTMTGPNSGQTHTGLWMRVGWKRRDPNSGMDRGIPVTVISLEHPKTHSPLFFDTYVTVKDFRIVKRAKIVVEEYL